MSIETMHQVIVGDCLAKMREMPTDSVDLVFTSPPYEDARSYSIGFGLIGQEWVSWCLERYLESVRICRGLVCWVVEGRTRNFRWSATPALLIADLHRSGVKLRKPPVFHRIGIPGSGGADWWRNDYEFIVCSSKGKLPWSNNTACGHPPKWAPGGAMSHRVSDGSRRNQWGGNAPTRERKRDGRRASIDRPSHVLTVRRHKKTRRRCGTDIMEKQFYLPPTLANPGNIVHCKVGGGLMGHRLAHENEAPFPETLVDRFISCFCPPGGTVLDPFCGSGTTLAVAKKRGRHSIGIEVRCAQADITKKRLADIEFESVDYPRAS